MQDNCSPYVLVAMKEVMRAPWVWYGRDQIGDATLAVFRRMTGREMSTSHRLKPTINQFTHATVMVNTKNGRRRRHLEKVRIACRTLESYGALESHAVNGGVSRVRWVLPISEVDALLDALLALNGPPESWYEPGSVR